MGAKRQARSAKKLKNITKQRSKYPDLLKKVISISDIILEILDARFPKETQNKAVEKLIEESGKKIIYVLNKSDLTRKRDLRLNPRVFVSCKNKNGIFELRDKIKAEAAKIRTPKGVPPGGGKEGKHKYGRIQVGVPKDTLKGIKGTRTPHGYERIQVGVIGYPNTGKSSLINLLIRRTSAKTGSEAGFTKGIQKLRFSKDIHLLDSPGVIPVEEYSMTSEEKIAQQVKVGGKSYNQVKNPELALNEIVKTNKKDLEKFYKIKFENAEDLTEKIGNKKGFLKKGGEVNSDRAARAVLKDWQLGKVEV